MFNTLKNKNQYISGKRGELGSKIQDPLGTHNTHSLSSRNIPKEFLKNFRLWAQVEDLGL